MPTITVADLQKLIQSASYEQFARGRSREIARPQSGNPYMRPRSRSGSKSRSRSLNRPSTAPRFRSLYSIQQNENETTKSVQRVRPQSAKSTLSLNSYKDSELDFTGLTNMMQGMKFNKLKKWHSKSDVKDRDNQNHNESKSNDELSDRQKESRPKKFVNAENSELVKKKDSNPNILRKNRSSSYSKFKYPVQHHNVKNANARLVMEHNIPPSLRRFTRYSNQPMRQKCNYKPPVRSVTSVKTHSLKSNSLPSPRNGVTAKPPLPPQSKKPVMIDSQQKENDDCEDERERNGSYHYVYSVPPTNFDTTEQQQDETVETARLTYSQIIPNVDDVLSLDDETVEPVAGVILDDKSEATDDLFQDEDDINGNMVLDDSEKKSYEDMNDIHSMGEISEDETLIKSPKVTPGTVFKEKELSSDDEIEEDIPEAMNYKSMSFTSNRGSARQTIKT